MRVRGQRQACGQRRDEDQEDRGGRWALLLLGGALVACGLRGRTTDATTTLYVRSDTDRTTVISPQVRLAGQVEDRVTVEAAQLVDAWTGASVDIVSAATGTVRERRYETSATVGYRGDGWSASGSYRYSTENDYLSHGGALRVGLDLAQRNTSLVGTLFGSLDTVGRAGDPWFRRPLSLAGVRLAWTQVLSRAALAELRWESLALAGYQGSPYRFVAIGGDGTCRGGAPYCVPEHVPDLRLRHAVAARGRHALGPRLSAGAEYRLYFDSWDLWSHTLEPDLALLVGDAGTLSVGYRYYAQGQAGFYRARYLDFADAGPTWATRDRKLSAFFSHGGSVSYMHALPLSWDWGSAHAGLRVSWTRLRYLAFVGLREVTAIETTGTLSLALP